MSELVRPKAIVTGASSGIGSATAIRLAASGFDVGITYNENEAGAIETARLIAGLDRRASLRRLDLASPEGGGPVMNELVDELGGVNVLVNNAGVNRRKELIDESIEGIERTFAVNIFGAWSCASAVANHMKDSGGGKIVNVSSVLAHTPMVGAGAYCAAKAALEAMSKVMAIEWAAFNVAVNVIAPGHTATPINYSSEEAVLAAQKYRPVIPMGRAASSEEVAHAICFLVDANTSYITGATLLIDGGLLLVSGPTQLEEQTGRPPQRDIE